MSPAHVIEPTYANLKLRLMAGTWPIGLRLDAARLADDFGVSVTPVRDCLNRLVGERLVDFQPQHGYRVALLTERTLRDLFDFNLTILNAALNSPRPSELWTDVCPGAEDHADRTAMLFAAIASLADNSILEEALGGVNDRLHASRSVETSVLPDAPKELDDMAMAFEQGSDQLREALGTYHDRRRDVVPSLIKLLEKAPK